MLTEKISQSLVVPQFSVSSVLNVSILVVLTLLGGNSTYHNKLSKSSVFKIRSLEYCWEMVWSSIIFLCLLLFLTKHNIAMLIIQINPRTINSATNIVLNFKIRGRSILKREKNTLIINYNYTYRFYEVTKMVQSL